MSDGAVPDVKPHRGIYREGWNCTDSECWCYDPVKNPQHPRNRPAFVPVQCECKRCSGAFLGARGDYTCFECMQGECPNSPPESL